MIAFTDEFSLWNPGSCRASAVIHTHGLEHHPIILKEPVTKFGTSYQELEGKTALEQILSLADQHHPGTFVDVFCVVWSS